MAQSNKKTLSDRITHARENHYYIRVGDKLDKLTITGAVQLWNKSPDTLYLSDVRLAGTEDELRSHMESNGYGSKQINDSLKKAFRKSNYENDQFASRFNDEIAARREFTKEAKNKPKNALPEGDMLASLQAAFKEKKQNVKTAPKRSKKGTKPPATLSERIKSLKEGQVINVTNIKDDGTGYTVFTPKADTKNKTLFGASGVPVVSSNYAAFEKAMNILGSDYTKYIQQYEGATNKAEKKTPQAGEKKASPATKKKPAEPVGTTARRARKK